MEKHKIIAIIGARPQFIKHFAFEKAAQGKIELITVHTGQHYDRNMSEIFFDQLKMNKPNYVLSLGGGNHGFQTGKMMVELEDIILLERPKAIVVYGDTNSTLAGALVASKLHIPVFHIEAGLRSYNKEMPEEVNRVLTDHVSSLLFTPSQVSVDNLNREGIKQGVYIVGDIMKDLVKYVIQHGVISEKKIDSNYYYITIHRPYNTDDKKRLTYILNSLNSLDKKVVMSLHPRTKGFMAKHNISETNFLNILFIDPQSYFDNLTYLFHSDGLITDSGGMQKEAYWLQKKCVTIRKETEWVETINELGNTLVFDDLSQIDVEIKKLPKQWNETLYGDGKSASLMIDLITGFF